MHCYFTSSNTINIDNTFQNYIIKYTLEDDNVLFHWCLAGQHEDNENTNKYLQRIVEKWITVRGHSFAANIYWKYTNRLTKRGLESQNLYIQMYTHKRSNTVVTIVTSLLTMILWLHWIVYLRMI